NGKITIPLLGTMIAGNLFSCLQNISGITSDIEDLISFVTPSIRVEGVSITSQ
ncbi:MAG: TldD/PmbA family protein, partial [Caldiserica bacterium]|nr:TldD/PmbA family protein [Caldisericota bacterium]